MGDVSSGHRPSQKVCCPSPRHSVCVTRSGGWAPRALCRPQRGAWPWEAGLWIHKQIQSPSQARGPGRPGLGDARAPRGQRLLSELVMALPQLSGDRAVEVSRGAVVTEGSLAAGLEKQKGWLAGAGLAWKPRPWGIGMGALVTALSSRRIGWDACLALSHLSVTAQNRTSAFRLPHL